MGPLRRRRPLLGAAMLAGAGTVAYRAGRRRQAQDEEYYAHEQEQDEAIGATYQQAPPSAPAAVPSGGMVAELERLKALLDQGVLTVSEFEAAKRKILAS